MGRFGVRLFAYCLMGNHVHLAVETGRVPLSRLMKSLQTAYAQYFNRRHRRVGPLFQGRYKAFLVDREKYFLALVRYIHFNPVKAGLAEGLKFRWSSHRFYLGNAPGWLSVEGVLRRFGSRRSVARRNYRAFMGEEEETPYDALKPHVQALVGDEAFADRVLQEHGKPELLRRSLTAERVVRAAAGELGLSLEQMGRAGRSRAQSQARAICGYIGREVGQISLAEMGRRLGRERSTMAREVRHVEERLPSDLWLRRTLHRIQTRLGR